jgi:hypothetical protein
VKPSGRGRRGCGWVHNVGRSLVEGEPLGRITLDEVDVDEGTADHAEHGDDDERDRSLLCDRVELMSAHAEVRDRNCFGFTITNFRSPPLCVRKRFARSRAQPRGNVGLHSSSA